MAELEDMERALKEVGEKVGRLVEENARLRRERAEWTAKLAELQKEIEDKLADLYLERTFAAGDEILIDVMAGDFSFSRMKEADTENMVPVQEEQNYG